MKFGKKNIFTFWHEELAQAPLVVQMAAKSWEKYTAGTDWCVHFINEKNISDYEDVLDEKDAQILQKFRTSFKPLEPHWSWTHYTDCLRLALLAKFGGVWADGTVMGCFPLDEWLPDSEELMLPRGGHMTHEMNSWFIVCLGHDPLLVEWKNEFLNYCSDKRLRSQKLNKASKFSPDYWLKKISSLHPSLSRLWFTGIVKRGFKVAPYFAIYYWFSVVRRRDGFKPLYNYHLPLDIEGWLQFNKIDWRVPAPKHLERRLGRLPIVKLCYKEDRGIDGVDSVPLGSMIDKLFCSISDDWRKDEWRKFD